MEKQLTETKYFCMTVNGTYPPKHLHSDYDLALTEAKRL